MVTIGMENAVKSQWSWVFGPTRRGGRWRGARPIPRPGPLRGPNFKRPSGSNPWGWSETAAGGRRPPPGGWAARGVDRITARRQDPIRRGVEPDHGPLDWFEERDLLERRRGGYPDERRIWCRNPIRAAPSARDRAAGPDRASPGEDSPSHPARGPAAADRTGDPLSGRSDDRALPEDEALHWGDPGGTFPIGP